VFPAQRPSTTLGPPSAQSPFAACRRYRHAGGVQRLLVERYFHFIAPTGSCAEPLPSCRLWHGLLRQVFAGCCQPLLRNGSSRRYLYRSFLACVWTSTPAAPKVHVPVSSPRTMAFPKLGTGRRIANIPTATSVGERFRSCSHSLMFRPTSFARHTGSSHPRALRRRAAVAFTSAPITVRYLPVQRICLPPKSGNWR